MPPCPACGAQNDERARFCSSCGAQLEGSPASTMSARKSVTVLFVDVVDSTPLVERLEPETARRVLDRYFDSMREIVDRHGGMVEKFIGDAVMAVFGVPVLHEDDALRAVRAAADMRESLERLNLELRSTVGVGIQGRIGVDTGEVVTGDPAGGSTFVTGGAVNVAARLQAVADPGEVLLGASTFRLVRHDVSADRLGAVKLKGKAEAVDTYRLRGVSRLGRRPRLESPFVGREGELELLSELLAEVSSTRERRLVTLIGEAGVGKSRLVEEFLGSHADDALVVRGRCLPYGEGITYWPLKEAIGDAAGLRGDERMDEARARIHALVELASDADLVTERVAEVIGISEAVTEHKGASWAVSRLFEEAAREEPLVVVFDDIQWAEPTFLDLVENIVQHSTGDAPVLVVCMARPELLDVRRSWSATDGHMRVVFLQPLSTDDSEQLLANLLEGSVLDDTARARIVDASDGLPLFVEEMVGMLIDEGALRRDGGRWVATDVSRLAAPPTIQALLAARLDQLDLAERAVLGRAAVEGQVFHRGAVEFLSVEADRPGVEHHLSTLVLKSLIEPVAGGFSGDTGYRFHHLLLRDVAYDSVRKEERATLHERFALWLDGQTGERSGEYDEIAGYHLEQAVRYQTELRAGGSSDGELSERAGMRLGGAGLRAHARGDWPAAVSLLTRAQALLPAGGKAQSVLEPKLADARVEMSPAVPSRLRSMRCYWGWPIGHRWTIKERRGVLCYRCATCGRERDRGAEEMFDPLERDRKTEEIARSQEWGNFEGWGGL